MSSTRTHLGGLSRRTAPVAGLRPTVLFAIVFSLTAAYLVFDLWVSARWRSDLEDAIGPVAAWLIPTFLAYIPAVVIGFLLFTLLLGTYRPRALRVPDGSWPAVTVVIAAWNEEETIAETLAKIAALNYPGPLEVIVADNNSTDRTAAAAKQAALDLGLRCRGVFEPLAGKHNALNRGLADVTTPVVVTVDADTYLHPDALACADHGGSYGCSRVDALGVGSCSGQRTYVLERRPPTQRRVRSAVARAGRHSRVTGQRRSVRG